MYFNMLCGPNATSTNFSEETILRMHFISVKPRWLLTASRGLCPWLQLLLVLYSFILVLSYSSYSFEVIEQVKL